MSISSDFAAFKARVIGKFIDYDGVDGVQCTDGAKEWLTNETGKRFGTMGNAIDWWNKPVQALKDVCNQIQGSSAQVGDLVIKRPNHVGIATGNINNTQVEILEENGHSGTGKRLPGDEFRTRWINRSDVAGLWRLKTATPPPSNGNVGKHINLPADSGDWHLYHENGPYLVAAGQWITILHPSTSPGGYTYQIVGDKGDGIYVILSPKWGRGCLYTKGSKFTIN